MKALQNKSARMLILVAAAFTAAALTTPAAVMAGQRWLPAMTALAQGSMSRVFVRIFEITAFALLVAFRQKLGLRSPADLGLAPAKGRLAADIKSGMKTGFAAAGALFLAVGLSGARVWTGAQPSAAASAAATILLGAAAVSVAEETLFRGVLFGRLRRDMPQAVAHITAALVFAASHFLKSDRIVIDPLTPFSGFSLVSEIVAFKLNDPAALFSSMTGLFLLGLVLSLGFARTGSIWFSCAVHFAIVAAAQTNSLLTDMAGPGAFSPLWGSGTHINGLCGWAVLTLTYIWIYRTQKAAQEKARG